MPVAPSWPPPNLYMGLHLALFPSGVPKPIATRGIFCRRIVTISILQAVPKKAIPRTLTLFSIDDAYNLFASLISHFIYACRQPNDTPFTLCYLLPWQSETKKSLKVEDRSVTEDSIYKQTGQCCYFDKGVTTFVFLGVKCQGKFILEASLVSRQLKPKCIPFFQ